MCVAYPMRVEALSGDRATVSLGSTQTEVSVELLEDVQVGEYVIVHAGFAIQKLSIEEAEETLKLLEEMAKYSPDPGEAET